MRSALLSIVTAVAFLSTSSVALAGQTMSTTQRVEEGIGGLATAVAGFTLHGTVLKAGAPWAVNALTAAGLGTAAATITVASVGSTVVGLGIYNAVRGAVGTDPTSPWRQGLPGFVSGGVLTAIGGEGIVQIALTAAAGTAGLGLAFAATSIIAVVGLGFLGYGAYQAYKAHEAKVAAAAGSNVARNAVTTVTAGAGGNAPGGPGAGIRRN